MSENKKEKSFGVIPVFKDGDSFIFCLVKSVVGHWGFPKGRQNIGESERVSAIRELEEETGIRSVEVLDNIFFTQEYLFERDNVSYDKSVKYFIGFVSSKNNQTPQNFKGEITELKWDNYEKTRELITYQQTKEILDKAFNYLQNL